MTRAAPRLVDFSIIGLGAVSLFASASIGWPEPTLALATTAWVASLLMRRRFALAPLGVPVALALRSLLSPPLLPSHAEFPVLLLAACLLGFRATTWRQLTAGGAVFPLSVAVFRSRVTSGHPAVDVAFISIESCLAMLLGAFVGHRARHEQKQQERLQREQMKSEEQRRRAVEHERARITRELHDIIWHSVSSMTVQGSAARVMLTSDDVNGARDALTNIEQAGHAALADMRRLLGMLRRDMSPEPLAPPGGLGRLAALSERMSQRGLDVELSVGDLPESLPYGLQTTCYRMIEESLERVLSDGTATVSVEIGQPLGTLTVEVRSPRTSPVGVAATEAGLRQRVELYNGTLVVTTTLTGEQVVRASLPLGAEAP